jgi:hypothetical protein
MSGVPETFSLLGAGALLFGGLAGPLDGLTATVRLSQDALGFGCLRVGRAGGAPSRVSNVADPVEPRDAVNRDWVYAQLGFLPPVRAVDSTYPGVVNLGRVGEVDGVALAEGDLVLLTQQADARQNGFYRLVGRGLERASEAPDGSRLAGKAASCFDGRVNANTCWVCSSQRGLVGTDPLQFSYFSVMEGRVGNTSLRLGSGSIYDTGGSISFQGNAVVGAASMSAGHFYSTSDASLKENLQPLRSGLADLTRLGSYSFTWKGRPEAGLDVGLLAQEVRQVAPEVVGAHPSTGHLQVDYARLVPYLMHWMRLLHDKVTSLEEELSSARTRASRARVSSRRARVRSSRRSAARE